MAVILDLYENLYTHGNLKSAYNSAMIANQEM